MIKTKLISNRACIKDSIYFIDPWFETHKVFATDELPPNEAIYHAALNLKV